MSAGLEVADIFRRHGDAYRRAHDGHLGRVERRVMSAIELCRTAALGGHTEACADCGLVRCAYNSCRNRHCPKCQGQARAEWLAARQAELLPVPYFHVVFTLPAPVAEIAFQNKAAVYAILFTDGGRDAAHDRRRPEASRRRDRRRRRAPHLGPEPAPPSACPLRRARRRPLARRHALDRLPARASSCRCACSRGSSAGCSSTSCVPPSKPANSASSAISPTSPQPAAFTRRLRELRRVEWVVYAKPPFGGPEQVLAYLGRYTHRVAIANSRLVSLTDAEVAFRWKDYRHHGKAKVMTLAADEFIRRFLLHTLPDGFHRIRHYGFLANGHRAAKLASVAGCSTCHRRNRPPNRSRISRPIAPARSLPDAAAAPWSCSVSCRARHRCRTSFWDDTS